MRTGLREHGGCGGSVEKALGWEPDSAPRCSMSLGKSTPSWASISPIVCKGGRVPGPRGFFQPGCCRILCPLGLR